MQKLSVQFDDLEEHNHKGRYHNQCGYNPRSQGNSGGTQQERNENTSKQGRNARQESVLSDSAKHLCPHYLRNRRQLPEGKSVAFMQYPQAKLEKRWDECHTGHA